MVGVAGKYKGCETCRRRRVKCSNERPSCKNCVNSGRDCEGYERARVFITGTPASKGRVASHPKKSVSSVKPPQKRVENGVQKQTTTETTPTASVWDDFIQLSSNGADSPVLLTALQTSMPPAIKQSESDDSQFNISLLPYSHAPFSSHGSSPDIETSSVCLTRLPSSDDDSSSGDGYCVYPYDQNSPQPHTDPEMWHSSLKPIDDVKNRGPASFSTFPNHQFFVRVHRPLVVSLALLCRRESHLSSPDWMSTPWRIHPKSPLDRLFDIALGLPPIFERVDSMVADLPTTTRRADAENLLRQCFAVKCHFTEWLAVTSTRYGKSGEMFWLNPSLNDDAKFPFAASFSFRDSQAALSMLYYWMCRLLFHRYVETVYSVIYHPVIDTFPDVWPGLAKTLPFDSTEFQDGPEIAANICRGLDGALAATMQPDILVAPMTVAADYYNEMNAMSCGGVMELMWLDVFKTRLAQKGQQIANVLQAQCWTEVSSC